MLLLPSCSGVVWFIVFVVSSSPIAEAFLLNLVLLVLMSMVLMVLVLVVRLVFWCCLGVCLVLVWWFGVGLVVVWCWRCWR